MNTNTTKRTVHKTKKNAYKPTLDIQHNGYLQTLQGMTERRGQLERDLQNVEQDIRSCEQEMRETDIVEDDQIERYTSLKDKKLDLQDELRKIDSEYNEQMYYTQTANILFEYYELIEKGNVIDNHATPTTSKSKTPTILDFFNKASHSNNAQVQTAPKVPSNTRGALLNKYMRFTDPEYIKNSNITHQGVDECCTHCGSHKVMIMVNDGYTWCTECDSIEYIIIDHEKPSYRDPPKEISFFAYKRSNHLNEWISQIQGKESTSIPPEVYDMILAELKKQKITDMKTLTQKKIKSILKTLGINKYYEHSVHIINRLTGVPSIQLSPELEEQLRNMFKMIQTPFLKHAPKSRKNFLSYSFVLYKLFQLLGKDEYLPLCNLLRNREKLAMQDEVWRKICDELGWEFYSSI